MTKMNGSYEYNEWIIICRSETVNAWPGPACFDDSLVVVL